MADRIEEGGIRKEVIEKIQELAARYGMEKVILFGSRARGDFHRTSDIDLAVQGGDFAGFALDVEEEVPTLLQFDIVNLSGTVQEELVESIVREGVALYEKI